MALVYYLGFRIRDQGSGFRVWGVNSLKRAYVGESDRGCRGASRSSDRSSDQCCTNPPSSTPVGFPLS